ncbi:MAG: NAD-dependent epimerase/dehydratase family protein, partial [Acidobacteria bacterium]|nr:NAD-dependent epimerase/dehydratase family protein [Acidobacteriota bacterium]
MGISTGQDLQSYAGTRVTIAGGTGFIGRWVARALSDSGAELTLLARDLAAARAIAGQFGFTCRFIPLDLTDFAAVTRNLAGLRPQILFNLAAYGINAAESDLSTARRINHELLPVLCDALAEVDAGGWAGRRLVHAGSVAEYGPVVETLDESMPAHPRSLYGSTKLAGTEAVQRCCLSSGMNGVTARLFGVYGPGERPGRLLPVLMDAARLQRVAELGPAGQQRDFLFVEDVAEGLLRVGISAGQ